MPWLTLLVCSFLLLSACAKVPESMSSQDTDPVPKTFSLSLVTGTGSHDPRIQSVHQLSCRVSNISETVQKQINLHQCLSPERLAATAGAYLLQNFNSGFQELTLYYHETDDGIYATVTSPDTFDIGRVYRCTLDASSDSNGLLEIVNMRFTPDMVGQEPLDPSSETYASYCADMLNSCFSMLDLSMDRIADMQANGNAVVSDIRPLEHETYDLMLYCRIHDAEKGSYLIAMPMPVHNGELYYIKHFRDDWEACKSSGIDLLNLGA